MKPSLGVVIPARNAGRSIAAAVHSAVRQRQQPTTVLVVDDGSTDDTVDVASAAGAEVLRHGKTYGAAAARDTGARRIGTDLVAFLDADDRMADGFVGAVVNTAGQRPEASLVMGRSVEQRDDGSLRVPPMWRADQLDQPLWALAWHNRVPTSAAVVPSWAYRASGGFEPLLTTAAEDYDLWLRLAMLGPFACTGSVGAWRRVSDASYSRRSQALDDMRSHGLQVVQRARARVGEQAPWFARVATAHVLRESARRSLAAGLTARARQEAAGALRANPTDGEAWMLWAACVAPENLKNTALAVWRTYQAEHAAWRARRA